MKNWILFCRNIHLRIKISKHAVWVSNRMLLNNGFLRTVCFFGKSIPLKIQRNLYRLFIECSLLCPGLHCWCTLQIWWNDSVDMFSIQCIRFNTNWAMICNPARKSELKSIRESANHCTIDTFLPFCTWNLVCWVLWLMCKRCIIFENNWTIFL